jgi:hypothetical protein
MGAPLDDRSAAQDRGTTKAIGPNGRTIHFDDLVRDGELVEVEGRPMIVYYDADAPDWFVGDEEEAVRRTFARHGMT